MRIDEMVKIKNPEENPGFSARDAEIREQWCDLTDRLAPEEELKNFVKSLTDDEFNVFVGNVGCNPMLPRVKKWRIS